MHQLSMSVKALDHVERVRLIHGRGAAGNWKLLSIRAEQSGLVRSALQSHSPSPALWQFAVPPVYLESRFPDGFIPSFSWCSIGALRMCYWFVCCLHATELGDFWREEVREALLPSGLSNGMRIGCITSCAFDLWQVNSASWFSAHHLFILWCKEAVPLHRTVQCPASQNCTYRELFGTVLLQVSSKSSVGMNLLCNTVSPAWTAKYRLEGRRKTPDVIQVHHKKQKSEAGGRGKKRGWGFDVIHSSLLQKDASLCGQRWLLACLIAPFPPQALSRPCFMPTHTELTGAQEALCCVRRTAALSHARLWN